MRLTMSSALIIGVLVLATPAQAGAGGCHGPVTDAAGTTVELTTLCFTPTVVRVNPGDTVTWVNNDSFDHNVLSPTISGSGVNFGHKQTFSVTFETPGIVPYVCSLHPGMVGTVVVGNVDDGGAATATVAPTTSSTTTTSTTTTSTTLAPPDDVKLLAASSPQAASGDPVEQSGAGVLWPAAAFGAMAGGVVGGLMAGRRRPTR